jgi:ribosomal protein S18 acetylase RimI-like enzyme
MSTMMFSARPSVLRCARCGHVVDWGEARLQIVCGCRPRVELPMVFTREANDDEKAEALDLFKRDFGRTQVAGFGDVIALGETSMLVAEVEGEMGGALAWKRRDDALEIVALGTDPLWQRAGVGGHLLAEAELVARRERLPRLVVAVSNDNLPAMYFYQRHGFRITGVVPYARTQHVEPPGSPGFAHIPVLDEVRLEKRVET